MRKLLLMIGLAAVLAFSNGCVLTRLISAPMRVIGGVLTLIPVAGDAADESLDTAADGLDKVPI